MGELLGSRLAGRMGLWGRGVQQFRLNRNNDLQFQALRRSDNPPLRDFINSPNIAPVMELTAALIFTTDAPGSVRAK